jgi:hypothetical protein
MKKDCTRCEERPAQPHEILCKECHIQLTTKMERSFGPLKRCA